MIQSRNNIFILLISTAILFLSISVSSILAATLSLSPENISTNEGSEFRIDVLIDTESGSINATDVRLDFPSNLIEVVGIDRTGSMFAYWVTDPVFSNSNGTIEFIGGSAKGLSGGSLHVLSVLFKTKGSGVGAIDGVEVIITASDGKGTNVFSESFGAIISSESEVFVPEPLFNPEEVAVEIPQEIVREAVKSVDLPEAPSIRIPLYPEEDKWYGHKSEVTALWDIPDDVIRVAIEVDKKPNTEPSRAEDVLVNGKQLGVFDEGVSFIHVQFKNNIGWGKVKHYKVSIDVESPLPFEITTLSYVSDDPRPVIEFDTQDSLSGVSHSLVYIDGGNIFKTASSTEDLGPLTPGVHSIRVQVFDYAGNSTEDAITIEVLPLQTPVISFISDSVSLGESIFITGFSIPNGYVDIVVQNLDGEDIVTKTTETNTSGIWEASVIENIKTGKYQVFATARDIRGATSYKTGPQKTKVRSKIIFSVGAIEFGWFEIFLSTIVLILVAVGVGVWRYLAELSLRTAYTVVVVRDIKKFSKIYESNIGNIEKRIYDKSNKISKQSKEEIDFEIKQLRDSVGKMDKFITDLTKKIV
jgi:hypothetical protein